VRNGHVEVVLALIDADADVNMRIARVGTALISAASKGHVGVAQALIDAGADVNAQNTNRATALMTAAYHRHVGIVQALLQAGANVDIKCSESKTAIDHASGKPEIIALLQAHEASKAAQAAAAKGKATAGVGAASQPAVNPKLCTAVAAKILKGADTKTDELVHSLPSGAQKRFAPSTGSAFKRLETTVVPTGEASVASAAQPSFEIMQPVMAQPMLQAQIQLLPNLIAQASNTGAGLLGLIDLLTNYAPHVNFDLHQAGALFTAIGLEANILVQTNYPQIAGSQLAGMLLDSIRLILGDLNSVGFTPTQVFCMESLNQRFALYAQSLGI
jgi:hypothetical protein